MGNRFGNYPTQQAAEIDVAARGFTKSPVTENWVKPSENQFGEPILAIVEITRERVAGRYTKSGKDEFYYQHHFI